MKTLLHGYDKHIGLIVEDDITANNINYLNVEHKLMYSTLEINGRFHP